MTPYERRILTALAEQGELYGVPLYEAVETEHGWSIAMVYLTCERLRERGLVTWREADPTPERGGRAKRYFSITEAGRRELQE